ncbi:MAG: hypothetical protein V2A62_05650 [Candidatus Woesearchaeota archaeon]
MHLSSAKSKKAQMEMIGLVVIVILITIGMLFMAQFAFKEDKQKKIFTRELLAYSTMSALMKTTISDSTCASGYGVETSPQIEKDLLEDCADNQDTRENCGDSMYQCGNTHSCCYLNQIMTALLDETLGKWGKRYELKSILFRVGDSQGILLINVKNEKGGCPLTMERDTSKPFFLNTKAGLVESVLYICN